MSFEMILQQLALGFTKTLLVFCLTLLFSMPLGLLVCLGRMSKWAPFRFLVRENDQPGKVRRSLASFRPIQLLFKFFIDILRGTPLMLQLLAVCYGPYYLFGISLGKNWTFTALILGFVINYAAYFAEIFRSGIQSIPQGQYEAAKVLGYTKTQTFFRIILPQVVKRVLLPVCNEVITLIKDTALASTVAVVDLMTVAKKQVASSSSIEPYAVAIVMYLILNGVAEQLCKVCERKLDYYR